MIAWQRAIRDEQALLAPHAVPADLSTATVREISHAQAKSIIERYEWLARLDKTKAMPSVRFCYGLFFADELAGVECFGATGGTNVAASVCGARDTDKVLTLCRGACVHWAPKNAASHLINKACELLGDRGFYIFVAYSDVDAGEIGTVYQAANWLYCGMTNSGGHRLRFPDGREVDARNISGYARRRSSDLFFFKPTRHEMQEKLMAEGCELIPRSPKHRYVGIFGTGSMRRALRKALRWDVLPYPKREVARIDQPEPLPSGR
jgi:hypothetical protein